MTMKANLIPAMQKEMAGTNKSRRSGYIWTVMVMCLLFGWGMKAQAQCEQSSYTVVIPETYQAETIKFDLPFRGMANAQMYRVELISGDLLFPDNSIDTTGSVSGAKGNISLILKKKDSTGKLEGRYCFSIRMWNTVSSCWSEARYFDLNVIKKIGIELEGATPVCNMANNLMIKGKLTDKPDASVGATYSYSWKAELVGSDNSGIDYAVSGDSKAFPGSVDENGYAEIITGTITNGTNAPVQIKYTVTPYMTIKGVSAAGEPKEVVITVNPTLTLALSYAADTICNGTSSEVVLTPSVGDLTSVVYDITVAGATDKFTIPVTGVTGLSAGSLTDNKWSVGNLTLKDDVKEAVTLTYTITPKLTTGTGCSGAAQEYKVTVFPAIDLTLPADMTVCTGEALNLPLTTANVNGVNTYTWTSVASGSVTGNSNQINVSAGSITDVLTNNSTAAGKVTYTVTHIYTIGNKSCSSAERTVAVTVNPAADMRIAVAADTICNNEATAISIISALANADNVISWTCTPSSGNVTGYAENSGNYADGLKIVQSLKNSGTAVETVSYHITQVFAGSDCSKKDTTIVIAVVPTITFEVKNGVDERNVCSADNTDGLQFTSSIEGVEYSWTFEYLTKDLEVVKGADDQITITSQGSKNIVSGKGNFGNYQIINKNEEGKPVTVDVKVVAKYKGKFCESAAQTVPMTINPKPVFELGE